MNTTYFLISVFSMLLLLFYPLRGVTAEETELASGISDGIAFRVSDDGIRVRINLLWRREDPQTGHMPLLWDPGLQIYKPDVSVKEDFVSLWWMQPGKPDFLDCWIWRAERTNPVDAADDLFLKSENGQYCFSDDAGIPGWSIRHPHEHEGDRISRYSLRKPVGSIGDVTAKGQHQDGFWNVELSRLKDTGHDDDLIMAGEMMLLVTTQGIPGEDDFKRFITIPFVPVATERKAELP